MLQGAGLILIASNDGLAALYLASALGGVVVGAIVMLPPLLLAEAFGKASYGTAYSLTNVGMFLGSTLGVALAGLLRDYWQDYGPVFLLLAGLHGLAAAVMIFGRKI